MRSVLVLIAADPGRSPRALEALRMGVGLALAENRVSVAFDPAAGRSDPPSLGAFGEYHRAEEYLAALAALGGEAVRGDDLPARLREAEVVIRWTG